MFKFIEMNHILIELLSNITPLTDEEKKSIIDYFPIKTHAKGTFLVKEGQLHRRSHHVIQGCVRAYKLIDGEEKTTAFFTENEAVVNFYSFNNQVPSKISLICLEKTTTASISFEKEQEFYTKHSRFESLCRVGLEEMMGNKEEELAERIVLKPEQRYEKLQKERPDLLNRVPQYQIASYLGITPEALSRLRNRIAKKTSYLSKK